MPSGWGTGAEADAARQASVHGNVEAEELIELSALPGTPGTGQRTEHAECRVGTSFGRAGDANHEFAERGTVGQREGRNGAVGRFEKE